MHITRQIDASGITLRPGTEKPGLLGRLLGRGADPVDFDHLAPAEQGLMLAIADLRAFEDENPGSVRLDPQELRLSHDAAASLSAEAAQALGLPQDVHLTLQTDVTGLLGNPDFRLRCAWQQQGRKVNPQRIGAILHTAEGERRIPLWMKRALDLAESFSADAPLESHWAALAAFRQALEPGEDLPLTTAEGGSAARLAMTAFLKKLTVRLADRFSISPADNLADFEVVPFSGQTLAARELAEGEVSETDSELSGEALAAFQLKLYSRGAGPAYHLGDNDYLVVDRSALPALREIVRLRRAPRDERRSFVANPRTYISNAVQAELATSAEFQALDPAAQEEMLEAVTGPVLVETREYSERVTGVVAWVKEQIYIDGSGTTWLPEVFASHIARALTEMPLPALETLGAEMAAQLTGPDPAVNIAGERVAVTPERLTAVQATITARHQAESQAPVADDAEDTEPGGPFVLGTQDNTDELTWVARLRPRTATQGDAIPAAIRTPLKPHQSNSLQWQIKAWRAGLPGVLNADEQGLGKTLQTIAFLAWLKEHMRDPAARHRGPVLIVAPTSLLVNWEEEIERHVVDGGFGHLERLYGGATSAMKRRGARGRDTDDGLPRLDLDWLAEALREGRAHRFWFLTTYSTLVNYQHSLGAIPFSTMVCDEIQAVKNENTLRAKAVMAMNADFRIGLTGTPIENAAMDLWTIMDILAPGSLGSGAEFRARYGTPGEENMKDLYARVFKGQDGAPPLALRRLKDDVARDLPAKTRRLHPRLMPTVQATEYDKARRKLAEGGAGAALKTLHHIRSVSVHPGGEEPGDDLDFVHASGRLAATFDILDRLHAAGERALIFVEHRALQYRLAEILRQRYRLPRVEIINGDTPIQRRQAIVNAFQQNLTAGPRFDILVLGPKAAGTGLTLTAATHVIHLSRWWNPAVEEQCNDRVHRIGQTRPVTIHLPMAIHPAYAEGSFDCLLQTLMQRKRRLAKQALWPMGDTAQDVEELQNMLRNSYAPATSDALDHALQGMFARENQPVPPAEPDGSRIVT